MLGLVRLDKGGMGNWVLGNLVLGDMEVSIVQDPSGNGNIL